MPTFGNAQLKLLENLCNIVAISGDEGEVRKIVLEEVKPYADEIKVDAMGNVLATRLGRNRSKKQMRVMLDAHMDEVGFMIVADDGEGLYRFEIVGGIDVRHLVGKQVLVGKERTPAVIGGKPIHLMNGDERTRKVPLDALRIDMGLSGKAKVGDYAGFATKFRRVGPSILSKSIDDRIGVATLIELFKQAPSNIDLCVAFSVQEEIGLRGAKVAAQYFNPEVAIAVDSTPAYDLPYTRMARISATTRSLVSVPRSILRMVRLFMTHGWSAFYKKQLKRKRYLINSASPEVVAPTRARFSVRWQAFQLSPFLYRIVTLIHRSASHAWRTGRIQSIYCMPR